MASRSDVLNAFRPSKEIDDPELFAGRVRQVKDLSNSLHVHGSVPVIYGHRGLGKSSLAIQLQRIAMGETELLKVLDAQHLAVPYAERFLSFTVTCTDATRSLSDLLQLVVNALESVEYVPSSNGTSRRLLDRTTRKQLSIKVMEFESTKRYEEDHQRISYQDLGPEEQIVQLAEVMHRHYKQSVLFVIDELDRMETTSGLASFIKAASSSHLKFVLVGIASNLSELVGDHQSLERSIVPVEVPPMNMTELRQITGRAEAHLSRLRLPLTFTDGAEDRLARVASGFPWFVHVLGQVALMSAFDRGSSVVQESDVANAILNLVTNRFSQQFADTYQNAVRDSYHRELVLRCFAEWSQSDIPTSEIYKILKSKLGVTNPSVYKGQLTGNEFGALLYTPVFQQRGLVRFRNEMFKAYVRLRPSIYEHADSRVKAAWGRTSSELGT